MVGQVVEEIITTAISRSVFSIPQLYPTINRLGGKINLYNSDTGGACVEITLPLLMTRDL